MFDRHKKGSWNCDDSFVFGKSQEPIWTTEQNVESTEKLQENRKGGIGYWLASFFLVAQMAGAGFLALPKSLVDAGWTGLAMLLGFGILVAFSGTRLSKSWVILEERWPEYRNPCRQPYMAIAERAFGKTGRVISLITLLTSQIGMSIVYIILIGQFIQSLIPSMSSCLLVAIVGLALVPLTWPGTPKDFWQASVLAVVSTFLACAVIFVQLILDKNKFPEPTFENPSVESFFFGFGTILFAFGGATVFPTIQNDMRDRTKFNISVMAGFAALLGMYVPVAIAGYVVLGMATPDNILLYAGDHMNIAMKVAVVCQIGNLVPTFLVAFNPICQCVEDLIGLPSEFCFKRCLNRSVIVLLATAVGLAIPNFDLILNLVGASTITISTFLLPPSMYLKLASTPSDKNAEKSVPLVEKLTLYVIILIGLVGAVTGTFYAARAIIETPFGDSCYAEFIATYGPSSNATLNATVT